MVLTNVHAKRAKSRHASAEITKVLRELCEPAAEVLVDLFLHRLAVYPRLILSGASLLISGLLSMAEASEGAEEEKPKTGETGSGRMRDQ